MFEVMRPVLNEVTRWDLGVIMLLLVSIWIDVCNIKASLKKNYFVFEMMKLRFDLVATPQALPGATTTTSELNNSAFLKMLIEKVKRWSLHSNFFISLPFWRYLRSSEVECWSLRWWSWFQFLGFVMTPRTSLKKLPSRVIS